MDYTSRNLYSIPVAEVVCEVYNLQLPFSLTFYKNKKNSILRVGTLLFMSKLPDSSLDSLYNFLEPLIVTPSSGLQVLHMRTYSWHQRCN